MIKENEIIIWNAIVSCKKKEKGEKEVLRMGLLRLGKYKDYESLERNRDKK